MTASYPLPPPFSDDGVQQPLGLLSAAPRRRVGARGSAFLLAGSAAAGAAVRLGIGALLLMLPSAEPPAAEDAKVAATTAGPLAYAEAQLPQPPPRPAPSRRLA